MHVEPIKASLSIEPGPLSASARPALGITQYCWPSYRRVSSYRGGDVTATFSFTARMPEIERWFDAYLGWEFTEYMYGEPTFSGYIASVRMSYRGDVLVKSLDTMANAIAINYEDTNGDQQQSSFSTNAASIARYGRKELIIESPDRLTSGNITTQLAEELGRLAFPRSRISDMAVFGAEIPFNDVPVVEVTVLGWGSTLNWLHYTNAGTGTAAISTIVSTMLTDYDGAGTDVDFVTAGNIETTSEVAPVESSDRPILDRVLSLSDIEDWVAGCFGSRKLDFFDYPDTLIYDRVL